MGELSYIPKDIYKKLELLKLDKKNDRLKVIGSYSYRPIIWSSDIDGFEFVVKDEDEIANFFVFNIRRVVSDIINGREILFGELKCGVDERYKLNIGECKNDVYTVSEDFEQILNAYHYYGLFSDTEYNNIKSLLNSEFKDQNIYEKIKDIVRNKYVIRWSSSEILRGIKQLVHKTVSLKECCQMKGKINIECITVSNDKYIDISNFYTLISTDKNGNMRSVNMSDKIVTDIHEFMVESLERASYESQYSRLLYNPIKTMKRLYSLSRVTSNEKMKKDMEKILNTEIGYYSSLISEIKLMKKVLEYPKLPYGKVFLDQTQGIKYKLSKAVVISGELYAQIEEEFDKLYYKPDIHKFNVLFKSCIEILATHVYPVATNYLKAKGYLPLQYVKGESKPY